MDHLPHETGRYPPQTVAGHDEDDSPSDFWEGPSEEGSDSVAEDRSGEEVVSSDEEGRPEEEEEARFLSQTVAAQDANDLQTYQEDIFLPQKVAAQNANDLQKDQEDEVEPLAVPREEDEEEDQTAASRTSWKEADGILRAVLRKDVSEQHVLWPALSLSVKNRLRSAYERVWRISVIAANADINQDGAETATKKEPESRFGRA